MRPDVAWERAHRPHQHQETNVKSSTLITAAVLGLSAGAAPAVPLQSPPAGQAILTSRGPVITTGRAGTVQTTTLPVEAARLCCSTTATARAR
jgi:hypothetical protein